MPKCVHKMNSHARIRPMFRFIIHLPITFLVCQTLNNVS